LNQGPIMVDLLRSHFPTTLIRILESSDRTSQRIKIGSWVLNSSGPQFCLQKFSHDITYTPPSKSPSLPYPRTQPHTKNFRVDAI